MIGSALEILFRDRLFERIRFVKFHDGVRSRDVVRVADARGVFFSSEKYDWSETAGDRKWEKLFWLRSVSCVTCVASMVIWLGGRGEEKRRNIFFQ